MGPIAPHGSPLVTRADGSLGTDLVAGAAPALLLTAAAFIALTLLAPVTRLVERAAHRSVGLPRHLSAAHISRGLVTYAVPVVLTVLAVGATTVSGMYAATSADLRDNISALSQGADVRAIVNESPTGPLPGSDNAPVWTRDITIGDSSAMLVASPMSELADVAIVPEGAGDPEALAAALQGGQEPSRGVPIPAGTGEFTIEMSLGLQVSQQNLVDLTDELDTFYDVSADEGAPEEDGLAPNQSLRQRAFELRAQDPQFVTDEDVAVAVIATLRDTTTGVIHEVRTGELAISPNLSINDSDTLISTRAEASKTFRLEPPQSLGQASAYEVIGLDLSLGKPVTEFDLDAQAAIVVAGERQPQGEAVGAWTVRTEENPIAGQPEGPTTQVAADPAGGLTVERPGELDAFNAVSEIRLTTDTTETAPVPLAITETLAEDNNLTLGSPIEIRVFDATIDAQVAAVVNAIPGTLQPNMALADTVALSSALLAQGQLLGDPSEVWISADDPGRVAGEVAAVRGIASASTAPPVAITDANSAARLVFWAASAGSILLAVVGIGAVAATVLAARRPEVAVLRALGMPPGSQASARAVEVGSVVVGSAAFGLLAGWLVGVLVVPDLATSTTAPGLAELPWSRRCERKPSTEPTGRKSGEPGRKEWRAARTPPHTGSDWPGVAAVARRPVDVDLDRRARGHRQLPRRRWAAGIERHQRPPTRFRLERPVGDAAGHTSHRADRTSLGLRSRVDPHFRWPRRHLGAHATSPGSTHAKPTRPLAFGARAWSVLHQCGGPHPGTQ